MQSVFLCLLHYTIIMVCVSLALWVLPGHLTAHLDTISPWQALMASILSPDIFQGTHNNWQGDKKKAFLNFSPFTDCSCKYSRRRIQCLATTLLMPPFQNENNILQLACSRDIFFLVYFISMSQFLTTGSISRPNNYTCYISYATACPYNLRHFTISNPLPF